MKRRNKPSLLVPAYSTTVPTLPPKHSVRPTAPPRPGSKPPESQPTVNTPTAATPTKKQKIKAHTAAAKAALKSNAMGDPTGSMVWYDPVSNWTKNAHVVRQQFQMSGLDPDVLLPPIPDYGTAFSRSILAIRGQIQGRGYTLLAAGNGPNGESRYSVVAVQRNGVVETEDRATVQCPRDGTAPFVERTTGDNVADDIAAWIVKASHERYETYTSEDVRTSVVRTLETFAAVPTRNAQPFTHYWAPGACAAAILPLSECLERLGWGEITSFEGKLTQANLTVASKAVNRTLENQLAEFAAEADKYANNAEGMRPTTIERRIVEAKEIKAKAELYRAILGAAVTSVDDRIKAVEASLMSTLGVINAAE